MRCAGPRVEQHEPQGAEMLGDALLQPGLQGAPGALLRGGDGGRQGARRQLDEQRRGDRDGGGDAHGSISSWSGCGPPGFKRAAEGPRPVYASAPGDATGARR